MLINRCGAYRMSTEPTESNENASPEEEVTQGDWNISKVCLK